MAKYHGMIYFCGERSIENIILSASHKHSAWDNHSSLYQQVGHCLSITLLFLKLKVMFLELIKCNKSL